MSRANNFSRFTIAAGWTLSCTLGCSTTISDGPGISPAVGGGSSQGAAGLGPNGESRAGNGAIAQTGGGSGDPGSSAQAGQPSGSGSGPMDCFGSELTAAKRIVRLSFNQIANSIGALIAPSLAAKISQDFELVDAEHRAFPPLQSPREGNSFTAQSWETVDRIAQAAGKYVFDNFEALSSCGATPTEECGQQYVTGFAERAYRRPLTAEEQARLSTLYGTTFKEAGASVQEAVQYGVYAILGSPQFLYRSEFGAELSVDGPLTQQETASMLSYFLTDDMPDPTLVQAVAQGELGTPAQIAAQVDRILQTEPARKNLHGAMMSYLAYPNLETQIIQDGAFTGDMRRSMYREAELFLDATLWSGPLEQLLVSRKAYVNATLAPIYGFTQFPAPGAVLDEEGFAVMDLPATRTGLLTQAGFLANRSRPDETSVVGRGLLIKNAFLCTETPLPPESIADVIDSISQANEGASQRELAEIRATTQPCGACHESFDAYGLALDTFDVLGRYRDKDHEGRPIDPSVTLPVQIGGGQAKDIVEVANKLATSGAFAKCMSQNLINYALADVSAGAASIQSCAVARVAESFAASDKSFSSLVKAVATSAVFSHRLKGEAAQ